MIPRLRLPLLLLLPAPLLAQEPERSLHWEEIRVDARLDAEGRLHIRERNGIVFDGAWNGGSRDLEARLGQHLELRGIARVDPGTGDLIPLTREDDLEEVDQYDIDDGEIRWRSRLEDDPPFRDRRIDYVLDYTVTNAVLPVDSGAADYRLDFDFLPYERLGRIERLTVTLALDSAWTVAPRTAGTTGAPARAGDPASGAETAAATAATAVARPTSPGEPFRWEAVDIPPGRGFTVRLPLRYAAAGRPATVPVPPPGWLRVALIVLLIGGAALLVLRFFRRQRARARFDPLPRVEGEAWLREHVFRYPPELVGAAWDASTAEPEVAGLLARLVQEGKLASRVEPAEDGEDPVLHLELKAPRDRFDPGERPLIDALFFDGRETTDTRTVREHYEDTGFDPAAKISPALAERVAELPGGRVPRRVGIALAALALAAIFLMAAAIASPADLTVIGIALLLLIATGVPATAFASEFGRRVVRVAGFGVGFTVSLTLLVLGLVALIAGALETNVPGGARSPYYHPGPLLLLALAVLGLAVVMLTLRLARPKDSPERLALRRRMAGARAWFEMQLERPDPPLRDEWFPYLLALGLGPRIDRWFEAHGPAVAGSSGVATTIAATTAAGSPGISSSPGVASAWTGGGATFGGGGGFSGGGVGGSWSTAAATVATGVAAPSSGGTAGGMASAGGGAAGGW